MAIQLVGALLLRALLVTRAATAGLLTNRLPRMMLIAALIAAFSALVGLYASYYLKVSSRGAIVLTCTFCFGVAWLVRTGMRPSASAPARALSRSDESCLMRDEQCSAPSVTHPSTRRCSPACSASFVGAMRQYASVTISASSSQSTGTSR